MASPKRTERPLVVIEPSKTPDDFWVAFTEVAKKYEWQLFNINITKNRLPAGMRPVGAISSAFADSPLIKELRGMGCLCIRHGTYPHPMDKDLPAVFPDREAAGRMAAEHFAVRGFQHVGQVINVPRAHPDQTYAGFYSKASELGMEMHILERAPRGNAEPMEMALSAWIRDLPKPIGILGYHAFLATKVCLAAQQEGFLAPQEVGVLSLGNSFQCELTSVPVSAIEEDFAAGGREAAHLLKRMLDGESPPSSISYAPKRIVLRQSTDVLAVPDLIVAKALRYIWDYFDWPLTVDDIALEVQVSRSTLERRFRRCLGRGVNAELRRKRLEQCCELLKTTSMSISELVKACGFRRRGYLHRSFLKAYGMTPGQFRRKSS